MRVGGFERSVHVVVTPTGTGWVDPAAIDSVEYLYDGALASVALQYSYLASWLYLLVDPGYSADVARALFKEIYGYWITLPKESRPRLYLHGISLGAMNSEQSTDLIEVIGDPFDGALWSGPPYSSRLMALAHRPSQSRIARLASPVPRRIVRAVHEPARRGCRTPRSECPVGADADRLPPVCERPGDLFRLSQPLSGAGPDAAAPRPGRLAAIALVPGRNSFPIDAGHVHGNRGADRLRPCLRLGGLHRRMDRGEGCSRLGRRKESRG
jgi:hypothetical protein